jgi:hypothetical protein
MKVLILYRVNSEHERTVDEFVHEFHRKYEAIQLELMNLDTRDGSGVAELYDVTQYPSIVVIKDDGNIVRCWQGEPLPLMDEVASYARGE